MPDKMKTLEEILEKFKVKSHSYFLDGRKQEEYEKENIAQAKSEILELVKAKGPPKEKFFTNMSEELKRYRQGRDAMRNALLKTLEEL